MQLNIVTTVKFFGSSAGGYASPGIGLIVDQELSKYGSEATIFSFAINPQTGFRPELIERIRTSVSEAGWNPAHLGRDPVLLAKPFTSAFSHLKVDFVEFARDQVARNFGAVILSDILNPIEKGFCEDVKGLEFDECGAVVAIPAPEV